MIRQPLRSSYESWRLLGDAILEPGGIESTTRNEPWRPYEIPRTELFVDRNSVEANDKATLGGEVVFKVVNLSKPGAINAHPSPLVIAV